MWSAKLVFFFSNTLSYITIPHKTKEYKIDLKPKVELHHRRAKKVLSDSPGLVDFAIGLVNSVFNLPDGQVMFYEEFE